MAKIVNPDYTGKFNLPIPVGRLNPVPADSTEVWKTLAEAEEYAKNGPTAFVGQKIYVIENSTHYWITDEAGNLQVLTAASFILRGYYLNGNFYKDSTYAEELLKDNTKTYIDLNTYNLYTYNGSSIGFKPVVNVEAATDKIAGVMKLYTTKGNNTDGTITQKAITEGITGISLAVDEDDDECLVLNNDWAIAD